MTTNKPNKHEVKTAETRMRLLQAAATIFVRDGYEGAELGEIAALAGRTKGSIYAQFRSKEDIFLELIKERAQCSRRQMQAALAKAKSVEDNVAAMRNFYLHRAEDESWSILLLEYRLFALRHPESRKRLHDHVAEFVTVEDEARFSEILGPAPKGKNAVSRVNAVLSLQPMISALVMESQLDSPLSDKNVVKQVTGRVFDALLGLPAR